MKRLFPAAFFAGLCAFLSESAHSQIVFSEDFTGPGTSLTIDIGPNYSATVSGGVLKLGNSTPGFEVGRAYTTQSWADNNFVISVDVHPEQMAFTEGLISVFAYGNSAYPDNGYSAELVQVGFTVDEYRLQIRGGSTILVQSSIFNILSDPSGSPDYTKFSLSLSGAFLSGSLELTANFTPDPLDNPTSLGPISVSHTVGTPDLTLNQWGIRQLTGGNFVNVDYDNFEIVVIPEPSTWVLLFGGLIAVGFLRWQQGKRIASAN
ncbi:MAG: hypothetical protein OHK005_17000 [Candidatus Methylacidiphilales bacterium]